VRVSRQPPDQRTDHVQAEGNPQETALLQREMSTKQRDWGQLWGHRCSGFKDNKRQVVPSASE